MLRTVQSLPSCRAFDAALRRRAFPPDAGSLLPGPLAATRTGLTPAGDDELKTRSRTHGPPPDHWAHSDSRCKSAGVAPRFMIRLGDGADSSGAVGGLAGGGGAWPELAGWFEQRAAQVLQQP